MGARGPRPEPTAIKKLKGNPGRRPLNDREPKFSADEAVTAAPEFLSDEARAEWDRVAPELLRLGLLTMADRAALAIYCQYYARWVEAEQHILTYGATIEFRDDDGNVKYVQPSPYFGISIKMSDRMRQAAAEFGMTPSARTRVMAGGSDEPADPFAEFDKQPGAPARGGLTVIAGGKGAKRSKRRA
jgi:P27 family predicted phage terminase small subunit